MKNLKNYLQDMVSELEDIHAFTSPDYKTFLQDRKTQKAVIRSYEVLGEIVKRLPQSVRDANPEIDWKKLAGFRDFLAHNYDGVVLQYVWIAIEDLPTLKTAVETLLANLPSDET